jgi:hypothetical protein
MSQAMAIAKKHDLGERYFVFNFFLALCLTAGMTILGAGLHFSWLTVFVGVLYFVFLLFLADRLYGGSSVGRMLTMAWTGLQAVLTAIFLIVLLSMSGEDYAGSVLPGEAGTVALFVIFASHLVFGLVVLFSPRVQLFLAHRRGEAVVEPSETAASPVIVPTGPVWTTAEGCVTLEAQPKQEVARLSVQMRLVAWALLAVAGLCVAGFLVLVISGAGGWGLLPVAVLALILGLVLWTTGDDVNYLISTKGSETAHLNNTVTDVGVISWVLIAGALLSVLMVVIGIAMA